MLDRAHRLTRGQHFATTIRQGRRAGTATLVLHCVLGVADSTDEPDPHPPRVGLVVGKAVGSSVTRSQVKRRLRHLVREHLSALPDGSLLVIRALPPAATAGSAALGADLERALHRILDREARR